MKTLIGGIIAAALGLITIVIWWGQFLMVLAGVIPVILLLGGGLAIYLGLDEMRDNLKKDEEYEVPTTTEETEPDVEKYKKEIDDLKDEIEQLKKE
jgi:hypothetical protein